MKKITILASAFALLMLGITSVQAQVELKVLTEMFTRFNDVNNSGMGVTVGAYYDFNTDTLTEDEDALELSVINDDNIVAGLIFLDEANWTTQAGYRVDGVWHGIGYLPNQDPEEDQYDTYGISLNGRYIIGQTNIGLDYGGFIYDTQTEELIATLDPEGEASALYGVNDNGITVGWIDRPDEYGTRRVPTYRTTDGEFHFVPAGQLPLISGTSTINAINNSNVMVGDFDFQPFMYDLDSDTFTLFEIPEGADAATFGGISENGIAIGIAEVGFQVRDAIIYHPQFGDQPVYLKDVLEQNGITIDTDDGLLGTAYSISSNGQYIAGWVNGMPMFAEGWIVYLDDLILNTPDVATTTIASYPNPVENTLFIQSNEIIDSVTIFTVTGQMVSNTTFDQLSNQVDMSQLAKGMYLVQVSSQGKVETLKVIKK